jgi:tetratricopeptide (TPR) repeat protein
MKIGRNDPCPCGSGKKYKKCCMGKETAIIEPDNTQLEKINGLMQKGYHLADQDKLNEACDVWWQTWKETLDWLGTKKFTDIAEVNDFAGDAAIQFFSNWVQDFEMSLERVSSKEWRYSQMRLDFTSGFRERFPNSGDLTMLNMGTAAGEALFQLGRKEEADAQFEQVVKEHPSNPWALIRWGDMYTTWMNEATADHERARQLYERALKVAQDPNDKEAAKERIEDLNH